MSAERYVPGYARHPGFEERRREFVDQCTSAGALTPSSEVLDIGCGIGGVAAVLADYLIDGRYVGLDVDARAIQHSRATIGAQHKNLEFFTIDVRNAKYNPSERAVPETEYRLPFAPDAFDLVVLRSVFTHMLPPAIANYVAEASRVLRVGGYAATTYFLLNDLSRRHLAEPAGAGKFPFDHGHYRLRRDDLPEAAVAVDEEWITQACRANGLYITGGIAYGGWDGRAGDSAGGQDLIIFQKANPE